MPISHLSYLERLSLSLKQEKAFETTATPIKIIAWQDNTTINYGSASKQR